MAFFSLLTLAVRICGIFIALWAIQNGSSSVFSLLRGEMVPNLGLLLTPVFAMACASAIMVIFPEVISKKLTSGHDLPSDSQINADEFELLACSIIGLYFLVQAFTDTTYLLTYQYAIVVWKFKEFWSPENVAIFAATIAEFVAAIWLLFGAKGVLAMMKWARTATLK